MTDMVIVVIHWKIRPGHEGEFFDYWSHELQIHQDSNLVGEFLSRPMDSDEARCKAIVLGRPSSSKYVSYFNVGIWEEHDSFFKEVIEPYVNKPSGKKLPFEAKYRERMILKPEWWRIRTGKLPDSDHLTTLKNPLLDS